MAERARLGPLALRLSRRERPAPVSRGRATGGVVRDAALLFALLSLPAAAEPVTLVIVDRVINTGTEPLPRLDTWLACPPSDADQRIDALVISPAPDSVETTAHGQQVARWCGLSLAPGATIASRMVIDATLDPGQNSPPEPLSAAERALYLADGPKYHLGSERIRTSAAEIAPDARGPQAKVAAVFDYVVDHLSYSRDGTWDAAGAVLERGKGSCSEYVFTFVALCRAKGIPARFVGGTARRTGSSLHVDAFGTAGPKRTSTALAGRRSIRRAAAAPIATTATSADRPMMCSHWSAAMAPTARRLAGATTPIMSGTVSARTSRPSAAAGGSPRRRPRCVSGWPSWPAM